MSEVSCATMLAAVITGPYLNHGCPCCLAHHTHMIKSKGILGGVQACSACIENTATNVFEKGAAERNNK